LKKKDLGHPLSSALHTSSCCTKEKGEEKKIENGEPALNRSKQKDSRRWSWTIPTLIGRTPGHCRRGTSINFDPQTSFRRSIFAVSPKTGEQK